VLVREGVFCGEHALGQMPLELPYPRSKATEHAADLPVSRYLGHGGWSTGLPREGRLAVPPVTLRALTWRSTAC
jgi:hypothetical protein